MIMNSEERYMAMPDKSHYILCSDRLTQIKNSGKRIFYFTFFIALMIGAGAMFNVRFNILSLFSDLMVGRSSGSAMGMILAGMTNIMSALFFIIMGMVGTSSHKFAHVFLFCVYMAMPLSCFMDFGDSRNSNIITFGVGLIGCYICYPALRNWRDYKVISKTEGFPYFNERLAFQIQNNEYKSENYREDYADVEKKMDILEKKHSDEEIDRLFNQAVAMEKAKMNKAEMDLPSEVPVSVPHRGDGKKKREEAVPKKSRLELARELAERMNKFDFEIEEEARKKETLKKAEEKKISENAETVDKKQQNVQDTAKTKSTDISKSDKPKNSKKSKNKNKKQG